MGFTHGVSYPDERDGLSAYPFADGSTLLTDTGLHLDPDAVADALVWPIGLQPPYGLRAIDVGETIQLWLGNFEVERFASATYDGTTEELVFLDPAFRPAGRFILDKERVLQLYSWPRGEHLFPDGAAELVDRCVVPMPPGDFLTGIKVGDTVLTGRVYLVGGDGVFVRPITAPVVLQVDAVGEVLYRRRACTEQSEEAFETPRFVKQLLIINPDSTGFRLDPDPHGEIIVVPVDWSAEDTTLRVRPFGADGLKFEAAGFTGEARP